MSRARLPVPPAELQALSQRLVSRIEESIRHQGPIPFHDFMERALYEPGLGYYSAGLHKLGESGDFVTAPELGGLFAGCLAQEAARLSEHMDPFDIVELGAGSGRLAFDILQSLPDDRLPRQYTIVDRSADLRQLQKATLDALPERLRERVRWSDTPPQTPWRGLLLANEVVDALPVERFELTESGVARLCVGRGKDGLCWTRRPATGELAERVAALEIEAPPGYRSEINLRLGAWLDSVTATMEQGLALFVDYGYPRKEYYLPQRRDGTLMCHYRHRAHADVFFWPGLQDLTAWVDFTALAEAGQACGLDLEGYCSQAMFLMGAGLEQAMQQLVDGSDETQRRLNDEARHLTLPGMMGERFQVMGLGRNLAMEVAGFSLQDLSYRL